MSITYTLSIPAAANNPSNDQPNMSQNTNAVNTWTGKDHFNFASANAGLHQKSTYVEGTDPGSSAGQYVQYSKAVSGSGELFAQKDGVSAAIQITRGVPQVATPGYTYLPGGILMQWGVANISGSSATFKFPVAFTTALYCVTIGPQQGATMWVSASSTSSVTITRSSSGGSACWVTVIGV